MTRDTWTREYTNVAIPAKNFRFLVEELLRTVARGQQAPVIPDITLKLNPSQRPGGGGGDGRYTVDQVVSEQVISDNIRNLDLELGVMKSDATQLTRWAFAINDQRLNRLTHYLEDTLRVFQGRLDEAARGHFQGEHRQPVYSAWDSVALQMQDIAEFPQTAGRPALNDRIQHFLSPMGESLKKIELVIFQ